MPNLNQATAQQWLLNEINAIYQRLAQGRDVSPAQQFYLEGQVKLLLAFDVIDYAWLKQQVIDLYLQYFKEEIDTTFWLWMEADKHFYLPTKMQRAPVYKS